MRERERERKRERERERKGEKERDPNSFSWLFSAEKETHFVLKVLLESQAKRNTFAFTF